MKPIPAELKLQRDRARKDSANLAMSLEALQAWGPMEGMRKLAALALKEHRAFLLEEGRNDQPDIGKRTRGQKDQEAVEMPPVCVKKEDVRLLIKALEQVAAGEPRAKETAGEALATFRAKNIHLNL